MSNQYLQRVLTQKYKRQPPFSLQSKHMWGYICYSPYLVCLKMYICKNTVILHVNKSMDVTQAFYALVSPFYCCYFYWMPLKSHYSISRLHTVPSTDANKASGSYTILYIVVQNYNITAQQGAKQIPQFGRNGVFILASLFKVLIIFSNSS